MSVYQPSAHTPTGIDHARTHPLYVLCRDCISHIHSTARQHTCMYNDLDNLHSLLHDLVIIRAVATEALKQIGWWTHAEGRFLGHWVLALPKLQGLHISGKFFDNTGENL